MDTKRMDEAPGSVKPGEKLGQWLRSSSWPLFIMLCSIYLFHLSMDFPQTQPKGRLGAQVWPQFFLGGLILMCLYEIAWHAIQTFVRESALRPSPDLHEQDAEQISIRKFMAGAVTFSAYVLLFPYIGFVLDNTLFLLIFTALGGNRNRWVLILLPTLGTVMLCYLFVKLVYIPLPRGVWIFDDFTIAFYRLLGIY